ncbi:TetR/AcrR family transcriptional regulator [Brevundimonas sp.]|uniref:TetR/AcrR family transcriptional regulator n=1 Tax=Brevundimonas sp. TaxID=1871086 RepID=UPI001798DBE1|nr:TetR/AcrR family transcriptional regulator [Brevundimonas sp.]MBA4806900.1 TetR/AcrR family transcriptional regulator [Brevundimonas sp.]
MAQRRAGRPSLQEAAALESLVLDRAMDTLRSAGFATISIDRLAAEIGVAKQTLYRRFASKEALLDAVVERELARMQASILPGRAEGEALETLKVFAHHYFTVAVRPENAHFAAYLNTAALTNPKLQGRQKRWHDLSMSAFENLIVRAQDAGRLRSGDPRALAHLLLDLINGAPYRLQQSLGSRTALDGRKSTDWFDDRFEAFTRLCGV